MRQPYLLSAAILAIACSSPTGIVDPDDVEIVVFVNQVPYESPLPPASATEPGAIRLRGAQELASGILSVDATIRLGDDGRYLVSIIGTQVLSSVNQPRTGGIPYAFLYEVVLGNLPAGRYRLTTEEFNRNANGESILLLTRDLDLVVPVR